ncbi:MAG: uracil-xanthine permease family protein [Spirochaetia bacterium]
MHKNIVFFFLVIQHVFAMFGATILVPVLTHLPVSISLLCAGVGTLIFHGVTKGRVPSFLGSSFAFISPMLVVLETQGVAHLKGGIIVTGLIYLLFAWLAKIVGAKRIREWFPPIIVGSLLISIGLKLIPTALKMCGYDPYVLDYPRVMLASITISIMVILSVAQHSFFRLMPILFAILGGYAVALFFGMVDLVPIANAHWFGLDSVASRQIFTLPKFSLNTILLLAPISLVVMIEHIDDIKHSSAVTGQNFLINPGLHRTFLGDGLATVFAGVMGGPGNVTYSENTSVMAVTKVYDPAVLRGAAVVAILLAFCGKLVAIIQTMPVAVTGAVSLVLLGMIVVVGLRVLLEARVNLRDFKNMIIPALIIIFGTFVSEVNIFGSIKMSGSFLATAVGIFLNKILKSDQQRIDGHAMP